MSAQPATRPDPDDVPKPGAPKPGSPKLYREGFVAGLLGAATIAVWFFVLDVLAGRPLRTPTVLGEALFRSGAGLESLPGRGQLVFLFTWVHAMVFVALGAVVSHLLGAVERRPRLGFGVLLLFVYLEGAFLIATFTFARSVLAELAWSAVVVGNLLAATVMAVYLRRRHPNLRIPA